ncbi:hypothetical protein HGQ62_03755 [Stenotrophomonas maltophilia]|nr:hypothetical protein [Stenotrophomonas maltophilia]NMT72892.1 hypothetical protein [Stenotrophomonas maltophilia]
MLTDTKLRSLKPKARAPMAAGDHERYVELVLLSDDSVDVVVRAIAGAFGFGVPTRPAVRHSSRRSSREEPCPDEGAYLPIHRVHSIEQAASKYLPAQAAARKQALETFSPKDRQAVLDFDQLAVMRSPAAADRTRQLRGWKAQGSLTAAPAKGPSRLVLHALADARLNNHPPSSPGPVPDEAGRAESKRRPNELLEEISDAQWLDPRAAPATGAGNPELATVGVGDRPAKRRREGQGG